MHNSGPAFQEVCLSKWLVHLERQNCLSDGCPSEQTIELLKGGLSANFLNLLLCSFGISLRHCLFDGLRCAVNEILGFLESEAGDLANDLDDLHFVSASAFEDERELSLLFSCCHRSCACCCNCYW